ncbi:PP0621 family protein [Marinomonas spartinae]|uniref:PP0621 family protein n=1 Tax=Marinomonas spartinae TaxID=1792290 RepID=UPI0018F1C6F7|nr:PP0621 family protein [Marinomonas spartinae]MBJ7553709.1 hypothetical protein [Marinomonas spartinae]
MIVRLIVFIAIFLIGWWIYRQFIAFNRAKATSNMNRPKKGQTTNDEEPMVRCEQCRTYVPRSHAVHDQEAHAFCTKEHLQLFHKQKN